MAASSEKKVRIRHACAPTSLVVINETLTDEQQDHMKDTSFHWVMKLSEQLKISSVLLWELVNRWDKGCGGFNVRNTVIPFTPADVCLAVGLPATGRVVHSENEQCYTLSIFDVADVTVEEILKKVLLLQDDMGDFCRVYTLLAFGEFYFPRTGRLVYTDFAWLLDDLDALPTFNWARAVYEYLAESLTKARIVIVEESNEHQIHLCGCAAILQIWAMNHLSIGQTPSTPPEHPFPRFLNGPLVTLKKKRMKAAFLNNRVTVALTAIDAELQLPIVQDALQRGQQHQYVHIDEYRNVLLMLRDHEDKTKEQTEMILALKADVAILKDHTPHHRENDIGGCSTYVGHYATPIHRTPQSDMCADMAGVGTSDVERGEEMPSSPQMVAFTANVDPPVVMEAGPNEAHVEVETGEHNSVGPSNPTSNITTRIKGDPRTRTQSTKVGSPYIAKGYVRKIKKNVNNYFMISLWIYEMWK